MIKLGVFTKLTSDIDTAFKNAAEMGFTTCQLCGWEERRTTAAVLTDEMADKVNRAKEKYGMEITGFWCGWDGPMIWDFYSGPSTLGLVPEAYRSQRLETLKAGSDFAKKIGVTDLITHVGFIPEVPASTRYNDLICALRDLAEYCKGNGQYFLFETGQETPVTLKRTIEDIGTGNLGINLDPANLILYGKANPVDALDVFGEHVRGIHGKDGNYPTDGKRLGREQPIGSGKVNYPLFIRRLKEIGYSGAITIEREITGEQQIKDILYAKEYLTKLISE